MTWCESWNRTYKTESLLLKSEKQRDFCSLPLQARYSPACGERSDIPMETCSLPRILYFFLFFFFNYNVRLSYRMHLLWPLTI